MTKSFFQKIYSYELVAGLFITTLIVSNIASTKIIAAGSLVFDAGTVLFPLAYIVGDIITEVYGYRKMRRLIYVGSLSLLVAMATFWLVQVLPASSEWSSNQAAYETILGVVWRIVFASIVALFCGEIVNAYVMARAKVRTKGKGLWLRMVGSSAAGSALDTVLFSLIAFVGTMSVVTLVQLMVTVFLIKMSVEIVVSPLTMRLIMWVKQRERLDTFEQPARYLVN